MEDAVDTLFSSSPLFFYYRQVQIGEDGRPPVDYCAKQLYEQNLNNVLTMPHLEARHFKFFKQQLQNVTTLHVVADLNIVRNEYKAQTVLQLRRILGFF